MRLLFQILVGGSIGLSLAFLYSLGPPWRSESPTVTWLLAAWAWVSVAFEATLLLVLFRVAVPPWIFAVVLVAKDAVFAWRLALVRRPPRGELASTTRAEE